MSNHDAKFGRETRREQVVQATQKILVNCEMTTAAIARKSNVSEGKLFRHSRCKDKILRIAAKRIGTDLMKNLEYIYESDPSPLISLRRYFILHLDYIKSNRGIPILVFSEGILQGNKRLKKQMSRLVSAYSTRLEKLIRQGQRNGAIRGDIDPKTAVIMFIGLVQVVTILWMLGGYSFPLGGEGMKLWHNYEKSLTMSPL